ncbi:hypothetical protein [Clostridium sp.]|uniref:hypothetical protein n=1 Tax=Clostridium sp. TaxID=1506 RepID=UPI00284F66B4|nr:hypothetical protein [Clostridium sp.]MDR3596668.1 hypothetical protein [Clostridium sp.]
MKIYLKLNNGRRFKIPAPIGLIKVVLSFGDFGASIAKKYITEEQKNYIDCIDFKELRKGFDVFKEYKGLKLVEVKSGDGTEVTIII